MRTPLVIVGLIAPVMALALPDDATLSRLVVGAVARTLTRDSIPEGQVFPSEIFTVTRVTAKK